MTTTPQAPIPTPDEASAPYFRGAAEGKLMLMRCEVCGTHRFPARDRCEACWSTDTAWVQASGNATLHAWVLFHQIYHPAFKERAPYNVAVVELAEGPRITTNIVGVPNDELHAGMNLRAVFERISEDVGLPRFERA